MIIWLEDPSGYRYLRESPVYRGSRRGFKRGTKLDFANFYKLVGYEYVAHLDRGMFLYRVYWLKTYDSGCPEGNMPRGYGTTGSKPCEAVEVSKLQAIDRPLKAK